MTVRNKQKFQILSSYEICIISLLTVRIAGVFANSRNNCKGKLLLQTWVRSGCLLGGRPGGTSEFVLTESKLKFGNQLVASAMLLSPLFTYCE